MVAMDDEEQSETSPLQEDMEQEPPCNANLSGSEENERETSPSPSI